MKLSCKSDPILSLLHEILDANISRVPDGRIRPLSVLELIDKGQTKHRGSIANILAKPNDLDLDDSYEQTAKMASLSGEKTNETDIALGLEIMGGFLKGFGIKLPSLNAHFKGAQKVSFSFENVTRKWIDNGLLGDSLANQIVDRKNPATAGFFAGSKLLLVDAVIMSNNFSMYVDKSHDDTFEIDITAIKEELGKLDAKIQVKGTSKRAVTFQGEEPLPFAFTTIWLQLDEEGRIKAMPAFTKPITAVFGGSGKSKEYEKLKISEELEMLDIDNE